MKFDQSMRYARWWYNLDEQDKKVIRRQIKEAYAGQELKVSDSEWGILEACMNMSDSELEVYADQLLGQMDLGQKIRQMTPNINLAESMYYYDRYNCRPYVSGEDYHLGIPGIRFSDGPSGIVVGYKSTAFPTSIGRGATFDPNLEREIGDAIGTEGRCVGANFFGGVCVNLPRNISWGRLQETYGEDPFLLGEMGAALVQGVKKHMMACVKHFACNSMENARYSVNVKISERVLHEVYLPHFKRCIEAGADSVMTAYNLVNGEFCGQNKKMIRNILKEQWGFKGFVISDFASGIRDTSDAVLAGMDMEMHIEQFYGNRLAEAVKSGEVDEDMVSESARRILIAKMKLAKRTAGQSYDSSMLACDAHTALARKAAEESFVLLKNEHEILPLKPEALKNVVVAGRLAIETNLGDAKGSSAVFPPYAVTPYEGIRNYLGDNVRVRYVTGDSTAELTHYCKDADAVIVLAGLTCFDEGEYVCHYANPGGDRKSLNLPDRDIWMIEAAASACENCIVCLEGSGSFLTSPWDLNVKSLMLLWYPGMESGNALARVLFGETSPGGRLPITMFRTEQEMPYFKQDADEIEYDLYHGYFLVDKNHADISYPFGFGLSYTAFSVRLENAVRCHNGIEVRAEVVNTGKRCGSEVVQIYVGYRNSKVERHVKDLKAFEKVHLQPGESVLLKFLIPYEKLGFYDEQEHRFVVEQCGYTVYIGTSSDNRDLQAVEL